MKFLKRKKIKPGSEHHPDFPANDGENYLQILAQIEKIRGIDWYLEIGSRTGTSIAQRKCNFVAVDPTFAIKAKADVFNSASQMHFIQMTSDDFFASNFLAKTGICPDLTFIDGLHLFEYALRDFMNAEKAMKTDGIICFHDVSPFNYAMTTRDTDYYEKLARPWTGDVWKTIAILLEYRPDLNVDVLSASRTGLGCVTNLDPDNRVLSEKYDEILARYREVELEDKGADSYYGMFDLRDPKDYLKSI